MVLYKRRTRDFMVFDLGLQCIFKPLLSWAICVVNHFEIVVEMKTKNGLQDLFFFRH